MNCSKLDEFPGSGDFYDNVHAVLRRGGEPVVNLDQVLEVHRIIDQVSAAGIPDWRPVK